MYLRNTMSGRQNIQINRFGLDRGSVTDQQFLVDAFSIEVLLTTLDASFDMLPITPASRMEVYRGC